MALVALAAALFGAVLALRAAVGGPADATLVLFVLPIALCAIGFGARGGVASAGIATLLLLGWEALHGVELSALGIATRVGTYLLVGAVVGRFADARQAMEDEISRHYELSLDLFCTATMDGYFERLNPSWEAVLGWSRQELRSRPFIEFVHPDDRECTSAEAAKLVDDDATTLYFRNRYRTADGDYRWLEWSARAAPSEGRIYASARDITTQKQAEEGLQSQSDLLEQTVRERTSALQEARLETLRRLALAAEYRDDETHQHTERVGRTAALIGRALGFPEDAVALLRRAAPLHDIGKVGVPDSILLKRGRLTPAEFSTMREHTTIGARILADGRFPVLRLAAQIALTHHERWDGTGYPNGTAREAIPVSGRIVAIADVFDALAHERPYKDAWSVPDAVAEIRRLAGTHFDPQLVEAFMTLDHDLLLLSIEDYDPETAAPPVDGVPGWLAPPRREPTVTK